MNRWSEPSGRYFHSYCLPRPSDPQHCHHNPWLTYCCQRIPHTTTVLNVKPLIEFWNVQKKRIPLSERDRRGEAQSKMRLFLSRAWSVYLCLVLSDMVGALRWRWSGRSKQKKTTENKTTKIPKQKFQNNEFLLFSVVLEFLLVCLVSMEWFAGLLISFEVFILRLWDCVLLVLVICRRLVFGNIRTQKYAVFCHSNCRVFLVCHCHCQYLPHPCLISLFLV